MSDYIDFCVKSEKGAPLAEYMNHCGAIKINLDEIWDYIKYYKFSSARMDLLISEIIDCIIHEDNHKFIAEAEGDELETFNEADERILRLITDWTDMGIRRSIVEYDWK